MAVQFAVLGDSHIGAPGSETVYRKVLKAAVQGSEFILHGGDAIDSTTNPDEQEKILRFEHFKRITEEYTKRHYDIIGNHDLFNHSSNLFKNHITKNFVSVSQLPGTQVKLVRLDNANGEFSGPSLSLVKNLDPNEYYIFDFHWPLYAGNLVGTNGNRLLASYALTAEATLELFNVLKQSGLPRNHILAMFSHHVHEFFQKICNFPNGYSNMKIYVCGCSGAHNCFEPGYYRVLLTRPGGKYDLMVHQILF